jgi:hypothetical protein
VNQTSWSSFFNGQLKGKGTAGADLTWANWCVGEMALLQSAGPAATPDIRRRVDEESQRLDRPPRDVADRLIFWRDPPPPGIAVDPARERERIRENAALGIEGTAGDTPIQQPRAQNIWQRLGF